MLKELFGLISKLQNPVPQYVIGLLPVIVTLGTAPFGTLKLKLFWVFRCLGCPFTGLFYCLAVKDSREEMCIYWLPIKFFTLKNKKKLDFRPIGLHTKHMLITSTQKKILYNSTATASVLDRLSSLVSAYYIIVGIISGTYSMFVPCTPDGWPYLILAFIWTFGVIIRRTIGSGVVVVKDPKIELKDQLIRVLEEDEVITNDIEVNINGAIRISKEYDVKETVKDELAEQGEDFELIATDKKRLKLMFIIAALSSIVLPWISVLFANYTPPVGFLCRARFLAILCSTWTINNIVECVRHINFDFLKDIKAKTRAYFKCNFLKKICGFFGGDLFHVYFVLSGITVALGLLFLMLLTNQSNWWVYMFGEACAKTYCKFDWE